MVSSKASLCNLTFDFNDDLTNGPVFEFSLYMQPQVFPHEPPTKWSIKANGWPHFHWTDTIFPPFLEGLEGIPFTPLNVEDSEETMRKLLTTELTPEIFKQIVEGRAQFVLEDYYHIPKEKDICVEFVKRG